jgi:hypothetical protein
MTSIHEGSGGDGYGRTQQEADSAGDTLASNRKALDHPTHACPVRIGWVPANRHRVTPPKTCPHVATRDPRAKGAQGCRGLLQASSWSIANPTDMPQSAPVGTSRITLEHPHPTTHSLLLGPLVPTYACLLMWSWRHTQCLMFQTSGAQAQAQCRAESQNGRSRQGVSRLRSRVASEPGGLRGQGEPAQQRRDRQPRLQGVRRRPNLQQEPGRAAQRDLLMPRDPMVFDREGLFRKRVARSTSAQQATVAAAPACAATPRRPSSGGTASRPS